MSSAAFISGGSSATLEALDYQGTWDADANTPTLVSSTGTKNHYYVVSTAGTTALDGISDWGVGDWVIFNGTVWQKVDNSETSNIVNAVSDLPAASSVPAGTQYVVSNDPGGDSGIYYADGAIPGNGTGWSK